jgi:hypothetical protein
MSLWLLVALALLAVLVASYAGLRVYLAVAAYRRYRGLRLVVCPETKRAAAVEVDARDAAMSSLRDGPDVHLKDCSRWAERGRCGEPCLAQIETAPADCLVRNVVARWYAGKACALCHRPIGDVDWLQRRPGLLDSRQRTVQWNEVPPEHLPMVFAIYRPVCWDCHVAESFRREHPDLVVDRPAHL